MTLLVLKCLISKISVHDYDVIVNLHQLLLDGYSSEIRE
jgi:hypothetical protein